LCVAFISLQSVYAQLNPELTGIRTVVIDAGHGGKDPGCSGKHTNEKKVTLAIALHLGKFIESTYPDIKVVYTRKTDVFVELDERAQIANRNNADLFICIHANAGPEAAHGAETYVLGLHKTEAQAAIADRENAAIEFEEGGAKYEKLSADMIIARQLQLAVFLDHSIEFATQLQKQFSKIGRYDRGVRQAGFLVLYKTTMPSVLIETGFLSNAAEENFLADSASQKKMATSMFTAFQDYKKYYEVTVLGHVPPVQDTASAGLAYGISESDVKPDEIVYRVQILTSSTKLEAGDPSFKGLAPWSYFEKELHKYTIGAYRTMEEANECKRIMREKGFEHAFVAAFKNGMRVNMN
jgi:N-acetylmuramoyl-L-alanine amidase